MPKHEDKPKRKVAPAGKMDNAIPITVMSSEHIAQMLDLPRLKSKTDTLSTNRLDYPIFYPQCTMKQDTSILIRKSTIAAVTAPYLRSVIAIFFTPTNAIVKMIQPLENRLRHEEIIAVLTTAYQNLVNSRFRDTVYFREDNATHMIEGSKFSELLLDHLHGNPSGEVILLHVHHDYIRIQHNLSDFRPILQVIKHMALAKAGNSLL